MGSVGIRELKAQASQVLRRVRDQGETVDVTFRGRVIARLIPASRPNAESAASVWADLDQLAAEIGARWPAGLSATDAVSEERRPL